MVRWGGGGRFRVAGRMRNMRGGLVGRRDGWKKGGRREEQGHRFIINLIINKYDMLLHNKIHYVR